MLQLQRYLAAQNFRIWDQDTIYIDKSSPLQIVNGNMKIGNTRLVGFKSLDL